MDLLAGYGSAAESGSDDEKQQPSKIDNTKAAFPSQIGASAVTTSARSTDPSPTSLLSKLPAPSSSKAPLFSGLPQAKPAPKKVVVQFKMPITYGDAPAVAEDEAPAKKKQRKSARGMSLSDFLPPPKNEGSRGGGGTRLDTGGGQGLRPTTGSKGRYDSDDDEVVPGTEDRTGMELGPGDGEEPEDNEAYRVDAPAGPAQPYPQYQAQQAQHGGGQQYDAYSSYGYQEQNQQYGEAAVPPAAADPAQQLIDVALAAEREKAVRRGEADPLAAAGIQVKEVKADAIRYMDPGQRANMDSVRTALGTDYEARLRTEAGPGPGKLAKRKHQIGSLFAHAKLKELEDFERRAAGMKTKSETQSKYGW